MYLGDLSVCEVVPICGTSAIVNINYTKPQLHETFVTTDTWDLLEIKYINLNIHAKFLIGGYFPCRPFSRSIGDSGMPP